MKTRTRRILMATVAAVVVPLTYSQVAWSQDDEPAASSDAVPSAGAVPSTDVQATSTDEDNGKSSGAVVNGVGFVDFGGESGVLTGITGVVGRDLRQAVTALHNANTPDEREKATAEVKQNLEKYFDEDVKAREQQVAKIEEQVKQLREKLHERQEKKQELVDLQLRLLVNEADGLGFFRGGGGTFIPFGAQGPNWGGSGYGAAYGAGGYDGGVYGGAYGAGGYGGGYGATGGGGTGGSNRGVAPTPPPAPGITTAPAGRSR